MAARKSCTKMTWSEAKSKCGEGGGSGGGSKNPNKAALKLSGQQVNHGKLLAAKIMAKAGPSESERVKDRQALKTARKDQQRQEDLDRRRAWEKEQQKLDDLVRPCETALTKRREVELAFHVTVLERRGDDDHDDEYSDDDDDDDYDDDEQRTLICDSKQLQLDEVLVLDAMYADTDVVRVSAASRLDLLQERLVQWQAEPESRAARTAVLRHPPLAYTLRRTVDDPDDAEWTAHLLLAVSCPDDYPTEVTPVPHITLVWSLVTPKSLLVPSNKPLESWGQLDQRGLVEALTREAHASLLGMPSVYELLDTWLNEHLFDYITKQERP